MTVLSYNTFGATQRSDMKIEMKFDINVSPVQKCPACGEYYFEHIQE
jgi:ribosomal protein L32